MMRRETSFSEGESVMRILLGITLSILLACTATRAGDAPAPSGPSPDEALEALAAGNSRFVAGDTGGPNRGQNRRCDTFANGQHPVAAVLACADSRAPVELLFDQGFGDLFVVRVLGNVADTDEIGTLEYGVGHLHTPLIVVLGHTKCGAVTAVVDGAKVHGSIGKLVDNIVPAADKARAKHPGLKGGPLVSAAIRFNVWQSIEDLIRNSPDIASAVKAGDVKIVGAIYDLHGGEVEWMGAHPDQAKLLEETKPPATADDHPAHSAAPSAGEKPEIAHHADAPLVEAAHQSDAHDPHHANDASDKHTEDGAPDEHKATEEHGSTGAKKENPVALGSLVAGGSLLSFLVIGLMERFKKRSAAH